MADVRMSYALDQDQRLVHVNDVQRGAAAGCACPAGGQPVWAKPGDELSRHFAHALATEAPGATESALHMAAKTMVAQSVNYIRQDNGAYPIWLRGECGYSAGTMPIPGQHLVAKTERQSTSNTRRDVVIQQPDGTSRYVNGNTGHPRRRTRRLAVPQHGEHPRRRGNGRLGKCCPQCGTA